MTSISRSKRNLTLNETFDQKLTSVQVATKSMYEIKLLKRYYENCLWYYLKVNELDRAYTKKNKKKNTHFGRIASIKPTINYIYLGIR